MKKVIVIGCPGSGKSTFSKDLAIKTGLPLFHLDLLYWNSDKSIVAKNVFMKRLNKVLKGVSWIVDGNYAATLETRIKACDTIFFLDYPLEVCLQGIQARKGKPRTDMPWVETPDETDEEFIEFIREYRVKNRPQVIALLEKYSNKKIVVFNERIESEEFLSQM